MRRTRRGFRCAESGISRPLNSQGQPVHLQSATGLPFTGNIPISSQAAALLSLYPQPNLTTNSGYNYQTEVLNNTHADSLQSRINKIHRPSGTSLYGGFGFRSTRGDSTNLFGFVDSTNTLGIDTNVNWSHRYRHQTFVLLGVSSDAAAHRSAPRVCRHVPTFLGQCRHCRHRPATEELGSAGSDVFKRHHRAQRCHQRLQPQPHGCALCKCNHKSPASQLRLRRRFSPAGVQRVRRKPCVDRSSSIGAATGSDFAGFSLGFSYASAISYGNPDKYFRQSVYDLLLSPTTRVIAARTHHQCRHSLGLWRADDRAEEQARESRRLRRTLHRWLPVVATNPKGAE